jgi:hypothetical protein
MFPGFPIKKATLRLSYDVLNKLLINDANSTAHSTGSTSTAGQINIVRLVNSSNIDPARSLAECRAGKGFSCQANITILDLQKYEPLSCLHF